MKRLALLSLALICTLPIRTYAVDCLPVETSLNTQEQIDSFQDTYGGGGICDTVKGSLVFGAGDIVNLDGLSDIKIITRHLWFYSTTELNDLNGLSGLSTVGGELWLVDNQALTTLTGLSNLSVIGEKLDISDNPVLENLDGLLGVTWLNDGLFIIQNAALTDVDGLSNVGHVGDGLNIQSNASLTTLGLSSLSKVEGGALVIDNPELLHVNGLSNLIFVGTLFEVSNNTALASCSGLLRLLDDVDDGEPGPGPGIGGVPDVGRYVRLVNNRPGCNLIDEIMTIFESGFESPLNTVTVLHDSEDTAVSNTSIAVGTDGLPVISYSDTASGEFLIAKCATAICTSALISAIDDPGLGHRFDTSIAIGNDGLPVVAYVDQNIGHLKVLKCNDEACAGGDETVTIVDGAESYVAAFPSMAVGLDGLPVISYRDVATGAIKVAKCNDPSCAGGDEQISTLNTTGIYSSIAVAPDGLPVIAYIQGGSSPSTATVRIAKCNDVACEGGDETISEVDVTSVLPGPETSIAMTIGAAGLPVISHYRPLGDEIRFVACNDAACSGADETITTIAYGGGSQQLSIATGADGYPIISYRNGYFGALMVAKCNDLQCSSPTIIMVDHAGDVGWSTSIAIGSDDLPVISYVDAASGALKIVHCGASSCRD